MDSILPSKGEGPKIPWSLSSDKINDKTKIDKFSNSSSSTPPWVTTVTPPYALIDCIPPLLEH